MAFRKIWIPLVMQSIFWFLILIQGHDVNSEGPLTCVNCSTFWSGPKHGLITSENCTKWRPDEYPRKYDACVTLISDTNEILEKSCSNLKDSKTGKVGCNKVRGSSWQECVCQVNDCNLGDLAAVKKGAGVDAGGSTTFLSCVAFLACLNAWTLF